MAEEWRLDAHETTCAVLIGATAGHEPRVSAALAGVFPSIAAAVADGALHPRARDDRDIASMSKGNRRRSYRRGG